MEKYNLPEYDADILTSSRELSDFFEEAIGEKSQTKIKGTESSVDVVNTTVNVKTISNWIMGDLLRFLKKEI